MAKREITVTLATGEPKTGLWCDRCALPSRIDVPLYVLSSHGVGEPRMVVYCTEHGRD